MYSHADFFVEFSRTNRPFTTELNRLLEKHDLSSSYWRVLRIIEKSEVTPFGFISDVLQIEKPALTKIIKKLSDIQLVTIHRGDDKREKLVALTTLGSHKMADLRKELAPFLQHALTGVSQEQIDQTIDVLQIIQNNIKNY